GRREPKVSITLTGKWRGARRQTIDFAGYCLCHPSINLRRLCTEGEQTFTGHGCPEWLVRWCVRTNTRNERRGSGHVLSIVLAHECRHRGGNLCLGDRWHVFPLTQRERVGPKHGNPDILRAFLLHTVLLPLHRAATSAVIRRDDEGGRPVILGYCLHRLPELPDEGIGAMRALEHEVVSSLVGPVVGFPVPDEQYA